MFNRCEVIPSLWFTICITLLISDVKYLFLVPSSHFYVFLARVMFYPNFLPTFLTFFFFCCLLEFLCIEINWLLDIQFENIFSPTCENIAFLISSLPVSVVFSLIKCHSVYFALSLLCFAIKTKTSKIKIIINQSQRAYIFLQ